MKSFFTRIQNKFDKSTYGGRYVETILSEISIDDPAVAKALPGITENGYFQPEYKFEINGNHRIADLAVLSTSTDELMALIEIKYDDHKSKKNDAQLTDYIKYCNKNKIKFFYLTQYYPTECSIEKIRREKFKHLLFSHFAVEISKRKMNPMTGLFINYLKERGLMMIEINTSDLYKLLVRYFNPRGKQGRIQNNKSMTEGLPSAHTAIMGNMSVLSQEISRMMGLGRAPAIDFMLEPSYKFNRTELKKILSDNSERTIDFEPNIKNKFGGNLYAYATSSISGRLKNKHDLLYIEYGYAFTIEKASKDYKSCLYVVVYGKDLINGDNCIYEPKNVRNGSCSNKMNCLKTFKQLFITAIDRAQNVDGIKKPYINALERIKKSIEKY